MVGYDPAVGQSNTWYQVEMLMVANDGAPTIPADLGYPPVTKTCSNGIQRTWVNGELVLNKTNVAWQAADAYWGWTTISNTYGGGSNPVPVSTFTGFIDHVRLAGATTRVVP